MKLILRALVDWRLHICIVDISTHIFETCPTLTEMHKAVSKQNKIKTCDETNTT